MEDAAVFRVPLPPMTHEDVRDMKLKELRAELKRRGLSPSGLKRDLLKRLEDALDGNRHPATHGDR